MKGKRFKTIILAAGEGTRMKSDMAKVLHPVCGKPMLVHILEAVNRAGSQENVVVVGHRRDEVKAVLGAKETAVVQKRRAGTGDAVRCAAQVLKGYDGDTVVLCGDTPLLTEATIRNLIRTHRKKAADCTVLTAEVGQPDGYGRIVRGEDGSIRAIREHKGASRQERSIREVNAGVYCINNTQLFRALSLIRMNPAKKEYYLTDIIGILSSDGKKVFSFRTPEPREGSGVNSRKDLAEAQKWMRQRILDDLMEKGVTIQDPATTHIDAGVTIGADTVVSPMTVIETDVKIGRFCRIGPMARVRSGCRIGDHVEIGNHTEISRARIHDGCFVKHFSFLGDVEIGKNSNIGAGVVTANFDGKDKHKIKIGSGCFIGSDTVLVAPLTVGQGAATAAGSVVPKNRNIPGKGLAIGLPARVRKR